MKKLKIKHPVLRWFAGAVIVVCMVAIIAVVCSGILYGSGRAAFLIWGDDPLGMAMPGDEYGLFAASFTGFVFLFGVCLAVAVVVVFVAGSYVLGNRLFNHITTG